MTLWEVKQNADRCNEDPMDSITALNIFGYKYRNSDSFA